MRISEDWPSSGREPDCMSGTGRVHPSILSLCFVKHQMSPLPVASRELAITNPLVLYQSLVATKKILPDPAQHRLGTSQRFALGIIDASEEIAKCQFSHPFTEALWSINRV